MNSKLFTPQRILIGVAIIALLLLFRECLKSRVNTAADPDQVNIRYDAAATNLNPYLTTQGTDIYTCARIFSTFADLDPKTFELTPVIIKEIPKARMVAEGPHAGELAFDFEILPEAVWDNGTPVTGNDWAFTLKLIYHPLVASKAFLPFFRDLSGIDIDPANPKKFTLYYIKYYMLSLEAACQTPLMAAYNYDPGNRMGNHPFSEFLDSTTLKSFETDTAMMAFAAEFQQAKFGSDTKYIVGCGPYKMETMNDQGVILAKKENWWGDKVANRNPLQYAYPKKLVYKVVKNENVVENMMKNGELDIIGGSLNAVKFLEMEKNDSLSSRFNFDQLPPQRYNRWIFNLTKPFLTDLKVRKALAHIVDYDHFIKNIASNLAMRLATPILPAKRYYAKDLVLYDFNIQKAKELLAEAGWTDSNEDGIVDKMIDGKRVKLVIEVLVPPIRSNQLYAESITETARLAGVEIKSVPTDITEIVPKTKNGDFETAFIASSLSPGLSELSQRYHSKYLAPAGDNRSRYINPKLDEILDRIGSEPEDAKRDILYVEAQTILHEELPEVFLFAPTQFIITSKKFDAVISGNRPGYYEHLFKLK